MCPRCARRPRIGDDHPARFIDERLEARDVVDSLEWFAVCAKLPEHAEKCSPWFLVARARHPLLSLLNRADNQRLEKIDVNTVLTDGCSELGALRARV